MLQNCLFYVNTLMIQRVLGESIWAERMEAAEPRDLTPLAWGHVNPYALFRLDMTTRLPLDLPGMNVDSPQLLFEGV